MPTRKTRPKKAASPDGRPVAARVDEALAWLEKRGSKRIVDEMATRYGIHTTKAFGIRVGTIQQLAKQLGRDQTLADALWETGWYEARMLTAWVAEPDRVSSTQMDRWARGFDNWAIADTLCFHLFDRTPHAWRKVEQWSSRREEFVKRAAFALLASLAAHDKAAGDEPFADALPLIEREAGDDRNFVKKGVSWALRLIGRRSRGLHAASMALSKKLAASDDATERWLGKEAIRDLGKPALMAKYR